MGLDFWVETRWSIIETLKLNFHKFFFYVKNNLFGDPLRGTKFHAKSWPSSPTRRGICWGFFNAAGRANWRAQYLRVLRKEEPAWHGWYLSNNSPNRIKSCRDPPGIEPGLAAWKAQALPLSHSGSLMKKPKFNIYKVNMTFSPKPLHSTASRSASKPYKIFGGWTWGKKGRKKGKKDLLLWGIEFTTFGLWSRCLTYYSTETFTSEIEALTLNKLGVAAGERQVGTEPERGERSKGQQFCQAQ